MFFCVQNLGDTGKPYLVTLNPPEEPRDVVNVWRTSHPIPSPGAAKAAKEFSTIQGKRGVWFCGAYQGYGFHEDGLKVNDTILCTVFMAIL
jgi:cyclopropane-fatty-acyl-phospholipid synthase